MAVDLYAVHQAVCDIITASQPGTRVYPSYRDGLSPPCIVVVGDPDTYVTMEQAMRQGTVQVNVVLLLLAGSNDRAGQEQIMRWLSVGAGQPESLANALAPGAPPDRTLGGVVDSFRFGGTRYATAVEYPAGSGTFFALGELELQTHLTGG